MSHPLLDTLRGSLQLACTCQGLSRINQGRAAILALPRQWVLQEIERVAKESLDLNDEWEYRRLLELAESLDPALVQRLVAFGLASANIEVQEAADDFS